MAAESSSSMLQELYSTISPHEYSDYINYIIPSNCVSLSDFQKSSLSDEYWVDTSICYDINGVREDMLFELFGCFSQDDPTMVHANMLTEVKQYKEWYERAVFIMNIMKSTDLDTWLNIMKYEGIKGNEIALYALARVYQRHVIVYTKSRPWTTVNFTSKMTEEKLPEVCDIDLLYMGNHVFAELKRKEKRVAPIPAPARTSIISTKPPMSEKSIAPTVGTVMTKGTNKQSADMTSTNVSNTNEPKLDTNVQYVPIEILVYRMPVFPMAKEIIPLYPNFDEEVETVQRTKAITGSTKDKPHMKECSVSLEKLTQDNIYAWTKQENVPEFPTFIEDMKGGENTERKTHSVDHQTHETRLRRSTRHRTYENLDIEPEQITKVTKKKTTRVSRTGPTPDRIAARRFHLHNKSKPSQDDQSSKAILPPTAEESIKTEATMKQREVLTKDSTTVKGKLMVTTHGIANRGSRKRNFRCPDCDIIESSR